MLENSYIIIGGFTEALISLIFVFWLIMLAINFIKKL